MNLNRYINEHKKSAQDFVYALQQMKDDTKVSKILMLMESAFSEGVASVLKAKRPAQNTKEASQALEASVSTGFLKDQIGPIVKVFLDLVNDNTQNGRLLTGWEDVVKEDLLDAIISVFDLGFLEGVTTAEDPKMYNLYIKNKDDVYGAIKREQLDK